jgi:hypothetical protein
MALKYDTEDLPENAVRVTFDGDIAEDFSPDFIDILCTKSKCIFDFGNVTRMNSIGTRGLLELVFRIGSSGRQVYFERCVSDIVEQLNMIPSLADSVTVVSAYVDEDCPDGHSTAPRLINIPADLNFTASGSPWLKPRQCTVCGSVLESDHILELYLDFVVRSRSA